MKLGHFYKRPPGHVKGRAGCVVCGERVGLHPSKLEADFDEQAARLCLTNGLVAELPFGTPVGRLWRFDRAWPSIRVAVELDGGSLMAFGGHTTQQDRDRDNYAQLMGWLVLRFDQKQLRLGTAMQQLSAAIQIRAAFASDRDSVRASIRPEMFPKPAAAKAALQILGRRRSPAVEHRERSTAVAASAQAHAETARQERPPG